MNGPLISILTPSFNRASYLKRVWQGLRAQTYRHFEWLVGDDGSVDNTAHVVRELAAESDFPVTLVRASTRVGKARIDNELIRQVTGDFILWCDSDDWLLPHALERLVVTWDSIPAGSRSDYVGITALCCTEAGVVVDPFPGVDYLDTTWNDLAEIHGVTADMLFFTRASELKAHPFPEVDFLVPESVVWTAIGERKTRLIPEILKMVEYRADQCVSFSGKMEYNRGRAWALATTERHLSGYHRPLRTRAWRLVTFIRYSLHGEIGFRTALELWGDNSPPFLLWLAAPVGGMLALKDRWQGKVVKTHRAFLAARESPSLTVERFGYGVI